MYNARRAESTNCGGTGRSRNQIRYTPNQPRPPSMYTDFPDFPSNARKNNKNQPATDESPTATMGTTCLGDG